MELFGMDQAGTFGDQLFLFAGLQVGPADLL
jgi:hypothetical protein